MCTYNGEKYINEQLNSLINQTYKIFEVIIQDDASTDDTIAILKKFEDKLPLKIYINNENIGFNKNFEQAILKANGDLIALCDQDDVWENNKLQILIEEIGDNTLIYSNSLLVDSQLNSLNKTLEDRLKINFISSNSAVNFLFNNCVSAHSMVFKKELLKYIKIPDNFYFDEYIAAVAASLKGVKYIDKNLVLYRQHDSNALKKDKSTENFFEKTIKRSKLNKKLFNNNSQLLKIKEILNLDIICKQDIQMLKSLKEFYENYENRFFSIKMFIFLFKNKHQIFTMIKGNKTLKCFRKSFGYKFDKLVSFK